MKTRREHLKALPLQKRLQAYEAIRKYHTYQPSTFSDVLEIPCTASTLSGAFTFKKTRQGHRYWWDISAKFFD